MKRLLNPTNLTLAKYAMTLVITLVAFARMHDSTILCFSVVEVFVVFLACNLLAQRSRLAASVVSGIFLLLIDVQQFLIIFGNSFLTLVMLTNVDSLEDLTGNMVAYVSVLAVLVVFLCLPVTHLQIELPAPVERKGGMALLVFLFCATEAGMLSAFGVKSSPLFAYADLYAQHQENLQAEESIKHKPNTTLDFYHEGVSDYYEKPASLPEQPNIVLIFTEGLSQNVVEDERDITPNVAKYQKRSLSFTNYYNHTFATYRGLIGQLFSGYQRDNFDGNTLISLPRILEGQGYTTRFINTEPANADFSAYLENFGFQEILSYDNEGYAGVVKGSLSDRGAYVKILEEMEELGKEDAPFFISTYTFGTHASLDSVDEKFEDGSMPELNKFYDMDYQFGAFMDAFRASDFYDNTVIVFTADHCTYGDMYFTDAFPEYERKHTMIDRIPLFIYHKGVEAEAIDVDGRNSLGLAPTVMDYLDISEENYFIGTSLFGPASEADEFETYYNDSGSNAKWTKGSDIADVPASRADELKDRLWHYFAAKRQEPLTPADV